MDAHKILRNLIALSEMSVLTYSHPMKVKVGEKMYDLKDSVSVEFINDEPCYILHAEEV